MPKMPAVPAVYDRGGEGQLDGDPGQQHRLVNTPTDRNEAWSVRAANAVPTWHATMPSNVMVVACR